MCWLKQLLFRGDTGSASYGCQVMNYCINVFVRTVCGAGAIAFGCKKGYFELQMFCLQEFNRYLCRELGTLCPE